MNTRTICRLGAMTGILLGGLLGCAVEGGGYGYGGDVGVGYVGDYYEPYGYDYGGWGPGYRVGPPHCCAHGPEDRGRPAPSIPNHPRGGGGHFGGGAEGGHGGGGHR